MDTKTIERFGKIIRGYIRCHSDKVTKNLVPDPVAWLAEKMEKTERTVGEYLYKPSLMNLGSRALLKQILREDLEETGSLDMIIKLIDAIPEK